MGGTSGIILDIMCAAACSHLASVDAAAAWHAEAWVAALAHALKAAQAYGNAKPGDATMVDPLTAAVAAGQAALSHGESVVWLPVSW